MNASVRRFRGLATRYLDESHRLFPTVASERGLHEFDALLGENDAATHEQHLVVVETTLREIEMLPDFAFAGDDWLDRRGLVAMLRTERFFGGAFPHWRVNPQVHCSTAIDAIFHLVVRHAEDLRPAREAIESRLAAVPRFLEQGAACLRRPVPLWTRLARQTCDGAKSLSRNSVASSPRFPRNRKRRRGSSRTPSRRCSATRGRLSGNNRGRPMDFPSGAKISSS